MRQDSAIKTAIQSIPPHAWKHIDYTNQIWDEETGELVSTAQVAEIPYTAFKSNKKFGQISGRLVVRRVPELNKEKHQNSLFDMYRYHPFFTTCPEEENDTVIADKIHRGHAIIE